MGKAKILTNDGEGAYQVELVYDVNRMSVRLDALQQQTNDLLSVRHDANQDVINAQAAANSALNQLDIAIDAGDNKNIIDASNASIQASWNLQNAQARLALIDANYWAKIRATQTLQSALNVPNPVAGVWIADYSTDLPIGDIVGIIEVPHEIQHDRPLVIQPGWSGGVDVDAYAWDAIRDGCMQRAISGTPGGTWANGVMLPGKQRFIPRYRVGVLLDIDRNADTGTVVIDSERSTATNDGYRRYGAGRFNVDPKSGLPAAGFLAPIEYMDCNSEAFNVGDRVVVSFSGDWTTPKIIGFETNPVDCGIPGWISMPTSDICVTGWGQPVDTPPGTCGGLNPWHRIADPSLHVRNAINEPLFGNITWFGPEVSGGGNRRDVLSWNGPRSRYWPRYNADVDAYLWTPATGALPCDGDCSTDYSVTASYTYYDVSPGGTTKTDTFHMSVCRNYTTRLYLNGQWLIDAPVKILGAAFRVDLNGNKILIVSGYDELNNDVVVSYPFYDDATKEWTTILLRPRLDNSWFIPDTIWCFSEDGNHAVTMRGKVTYGDPNGDLGVGDEPFDDNIYRHVLSLDISENTSGTTAIISDEGQSVGFDSFIRKIECDASDDNGTIIAVDFIGNNRVELVGRGINVPAVLEKRYMNQTSTVLLNKDLGDQYENPYGESRSFNMEIDDGLKGKEWNLDIENSGISKLAWYFLYHVDLRTNPVSIMMVHSKTIGDPINLNEETSWFDVQFRVPFGKITTHAGEARVTLANSKPSSGVIEPHNCDYSGIFRFNQSENRPSPQFEVGVSPKAPDFGNFYIGVAPNDELFVSMYWYAPFLGIAEGNPIGYHFSMGDPVQILEIPGANPRFHPLTYVGR